MLKRTNYLSKRYDRENGHSLAEYERDGGYKQAGPASRWA